MKYTITIKDNESGEIVREVECNSLIAGASLDDENSVSIGISNCSNAELIGACQSAKKAIYKVLKNDPAVMILFTLFEMKLMQEMKSEKQGEEDTDND